jgi:competence protein ComEA
VPWAVHNRGRRPQPACAATGRAGRVLAFDGVRSSARRSDDADLIRARLRAVLAEMAPAPGWVPPDDPPDELDDDGDEQDAPDEWGPRGRRVDVRGDRDDDPDGDPDDALPAGLGRHRAPGAAARLDPGRSGAWALWLAGVLAAVVVAGWTWLDRPAVEPVVVDAPVASAPPDAPVPGPAPTAAPTTAVSVVVSVVGQVARPGLVTLPAGSRVADALAAAGGLLPEADPASVNAAAPLTDGEQIAVGVPGAPAPAGATAGSGSGGAGGLLDLNAATVADLDALPGIGPVLAQRIVDHRSAQGRFTSVAQLEDVPGIGPATFADLEGRLTVRPRRRRAAHRPAGRCASSTSARAVHSPGRWDPAPAGAS